MNITDLNKIVSFKQQMDFEPARAYKPIFEGKRKGRFAAGWQAVVKITQMDDRKLVDVVRRPEPASRCRAKKLDSWNTAATSVISLASNA